VEESAGTTRRSLTQTLKSDAGFAALLFLVALLPRLYVALAWAREPVWDGHYYHFGATRIADGLGYSEDIVIGGQQIWKPWCHYPVGYSGFLGLVYKAFGQGLWVAPVSNAVVGALTAVLVFALARHWLCAFRAKLAGALCALHPGLVLYTALVMTEPLSAFTIVLGGFCAVQFRGRALAWIGAGLALGTGALVRPPALLGVPWLLPAFFDGGARANASTSTSTSLLWRLRDNWPSFRRALLRTVGVGAIALLTIAPWTLRNCRVMDGCTLISTNGGWNLAIGAVTETGRFSPLKAEWGCPGPGQVAQDRCWREHGQATIARDPLAWLAKIPTKLSHTYSHESFAVGYLGEADPARWNEARKHSWRSTTTGFHNLLMLAASLGVVALGGRLRPRPTPGLLVQAGLLASIGAFAWWALQAPQWPVFWLIVVAPLVALLPLPGAPRRGPVASYAWGMVLVTSVTHAIFFGEDRYHLAISPLLCMLAASALRRSRATDETPHAP
jgi:hypothetical protein